LDIPTPANVDMYRRSIAFVEDKLGHCSSLIIILNIIRPYNTKYISPYYTSTIGGEKLRFLCCLASFETPKLSGGKVPGLHTSFYNRRHIKPRYLYELRKSFVFIIIYSIIIYIYKYLYQSMIRVSFPWQNDRG